MSLLLLACQCASDDVVVDSDTGCVETTWYVDGDGDDFGAEAVSSCEQPEGTVEVGGDCDDEDPQRHPAATELCDGVDRDCDGVASVEVLFVDEDGDGYGDQIVAACEPEEGLSELAGDCDDTDATIYPSATEVPYDGIDQDCDGEDLTDVDGDGASVEDDCDDNDARRHPWSIETCGDGVDNDCNDIAEDCLTFEGTPIELGAVIWGNRAQQNVSGGGAWTGYPSMERAGDIDGDGSDDLVLVGDEGDNYGFFHVVQGPFVGETWVRDGLAHAGPSADTYYAQVAGGIDLNGDLVVDWMCSDADSDTAWLISGASTGLAADLSPISEITRGYDGDLDVLDLGNQILAGELNGDASPDVLVSAWLTEDPTSTDEKWVSKTVGAAYIFFGPLSGAQTTDDAEALISGPWMSSIGAWAAAIDSDGNGTADLVLGTRNERPGGTGESGSGLYLFEGPIASGTTSAIDADHRVGDSSSEHWELARSVRDGGDLNADGYPDLLIDSTRRLSGGEYAPTWILPGPLTVTNVDDAPIIIYDEGWGVAEADAAGDINGDGFDDLVVGGLGDDENGRGHARIFLGPFVPGTYESTDAAGTAVGLEESFVCDAGPSCTNLGSMLGLIVRGAGDLDDDGYDDLAISAPSESWDPELHGPGAVYIFYGAEF